MGLMRRLSDVLQQKLNALLDRAEDPTESLDLAYERQLEALQQVRRNVAEVLTSQKRLELQAAQLLQVQARQALAQGREDLARLALTRAQAAESQLDALETQAAQLKEQEQKLELTAQKLQAKVEAFRTQKETIKAQYSAAEASTRIGEAVTGISEQMADVSLMIDRAQEKTARMQARAAAIDQLVETGVLDQIGPGAQDDIDRQLAAPAAEAAVEERLRKLKAEVGAPALEPAGEVVRVLGEDQYRVRPEDQGRLDELDERLTAALEARDEATYRHTLEETVAFVRDRGERIPDSVVVRSDRVLPGGDMSLEEAIRVIEAAPSRPVNAPGDAG